MGWSCHTARSPKLSSNYKLLLSTFVAGLFSLAILGNLCEGMLCGVIIGRTSHAGGSSSWVYPWSIIGIHVIQARRNFLSFPAACGGRRIAMCSLGCSLKVTKPNTSEFNLESFLSLPLSIPFVTLRSKPSRKPIVVQVHVKTWRLRRQSFPQSLNEQLGAMPCQGLVKYQIWKGDWPP